MLLKKIAVMATVVCLLVVSTCCISFAASKKQNNQQSYRVIQVYQLDGKASVLRPGTEKMDAYEGMNLASGDEVIVSPNSQIYLKLDNDKYIMANSSSDIILEATGNATDSRTKITVKKGSVMNRVDGHLNQNSSYEVHTPNATMAIRGTQVNVALMDNPDGTQSTITQVFEGTVESHAIKPDGQIDPTPVMVNEGERQDFMTSEEGTKTQEKREVDYTRQNKATLNFLIESMDEGRELPVSKESLETVVEEKEAKEQEMRESSSSSSSVNTAILQQAEQAYAEYLAQQANQQISGGEGSQTSGGDDPQTKEKDKKYSYDWKYPWWWWYLFKK